MTPRLWIVRADSGDFAPHFLTGEYAGIGWSALATDLNAFESLDELKDEYRHTHPKAKSNLVVGMNAGQIWRFKNDIQAGDFIVTPQANARKLQYGQVSPDPSYYFDPIRADGCRYMHRRRVKWSKSLLDRAELSVPFQSSLRAKLTIYELTHLDEFLVAIGQSGHRPIISKLGAQDSYTVVLERILELDPTEFEYLVAALLTALGFDDPEVVGGVGDGGVDAKGVLEIANIASIRIYVQAKRYAQGRRVKSSEIRKLRGMIPNGGQGALITTGDFRKDAHEIASEAGFAPIGLVNGRQLVDLLIEHWSDIPVEFQSRLGLRPGLVPIQ